MHYAARLNSFINSDNKDILTAIEEVAQTGTVTKIDLNYPEHFESVSLDEIQRAMAEHHLTLGSLNMRFKQMFINGAFSNPLVEIRRKAIELTLQAAQICKALNGYQVIVWLAYDGYDYSLQMNYSRVWDYLVNAFCEVCQKSEVRIAIEYKPYEERGFSLLDSFGTTLALIHDCNTQNLGVVLDFCHMLMKRENPAFAASYLLDRGLLYGVHLNDGEGNTDNGFMTAMSNPWKTIELLYYLKKYKYNGVIYFDTFPRRESPGEELCANKEMCEHLLTMLNSETMKLIENASEKQDAIELQKIAVKLLRGI